MAFHFEFSNEALNIYILLKKSTRLKSEIITLGNAWKRLETLGNAWRRMETHGNAWKRTETHGNAENCRKLA